MLKRTLPLLILSLNVLTLCQGHFLWQIESEPPSYLYGTVHSSDRSVRELPPEVIDALKTSRSFHPELAFSPENLGKLTAAIFAPTVNENFDYELPPSLRERLNAAAENAGIPPVLIQRIPLQMLPLVFSAPPESNFNQVVDVQVYELAKEHELIIKELETVDEQVGVFRNLSREDAIRFLEDALEEFENGFPTQKTLLDAYSRGDLETLMASFAEEMEEINLPELARELLENRNHRMTERLLPFLESGGAFAAVGVAHLPGEEGIVELLREKGWNVERVPLSRSTQTEKETSRK